MLLQFLVAALGRFVEEMLHRKHGFRQFANVDAGVGAGELQLMPFGGLGIREGGEGIVVGIDGLLPLLAGFEVQRDLDARLGFLARNPGLAGAEVVGQQPHGSEHPQEDEKVLFHDIP